METIKEQLKALKASLDWKDYKADGYVSSLMYWCTRKGLTDSQARILCDYAIQSEKSSRLDIDSVFNKMSELRQAHIDEGTSPELALSFAFDYGRELIGFDLAEAWRLGVMASSEAANV